MQDGGVSWFRLDGLGTTEAETHSSSANNVSFLHQLSNELTDAAVADYIIHTIHRYDIIIIHAFLLVIEMQMYGRVIFALAMTHIFDSNSAANKAIGLKSLLSSSFTLYYLALKQQLQIVFPSL